MKLKYIVFKDAMGDLFPVAFTQLFQHAYFAKLVRGAGHGLEVDSAGFVGFGNYEGGKTVSCWGESVSLKVKSQPERDGMLFEREERF